MTLAANYYDGHSIRWVKCRDVNANHPDGPHEDCHYLNSEVRNKYEKQLGKINAAYVGQGYAAIFLEPKRVKLADVARSIPQNLRGNSYQLYLINQQKYWNNEPLYILDEWSAYMSRDRLKQYNNTLESFNLQNTAEFMVYAKYLLALLKRHEPEYSDMKRLEKFIKYMSAWTTYYIVNGDGRAAEQYLGKVYFPID